MKIKFHGATQSVTGSMTLVEHRGELFCVDAGFYQGENAQEAILRPLPFDPRELRAVFLTHAHLDHSGMLPRLTHLGFRGAVYCTPQTAKLARLILSDSAGLLEKNPHPRMAHFYDSADVQTAISLFKPIPLHQPFKVEGLTARFQSAGHILGAASVELHGDKRVLFSGDLGRSDDVLFNPPEAPQGEYDLVVMESTYGDRLRPPGMEAELNSFLVRLHAEGRTGIFASFAVARAQTLLYLIHRFFERHPEHKIPVHVDGPMLLSANRIYQNFAQDTKDPTGLMAALTAFDQIENPGERRNVQREEGARLFLSSSGMLSGGPVLSHLAALADDPRAVLFLPGYMSPGTLGHAFLQGERTFPDRVLGMVKWHGEVLHSDCFSSHADQRELLAWTASLPRHTRVALVHGEASAKTQLKGTLEAQELSAFIPETGEVVAL